jgi:hypothetical protein
MNVGITENGVHINTGVLVMYVQQGEKRPLSGLGISEQAAGVRKSAYISVFGPQPGDVVGKDILGQYISAMDFLAASRANLMAAAAFKFWTRSRNGYASASSQKGPGFLAFDTPRDARFAFDIACIQRLGGLKATGVVDRTTLELLFALDGEPFRDSWPGKWAHTNTIRELGRSSENDKVALIIAGIGVGWKVESPVWRTRTASMTLANKVMNAAGKSNKPAYPAAVNVALTCQRNLRLALRDIWWVGNDSRITTPESPDVYQAIVEFTNATGRSAMRQRAGQLGAAEPDIMSLLKAHVSINSGLANIQPRPVKRIFMFVNDSCELPVSPRIVIEGITPYGYSCVKSKISAKNYLDKAVADLNTSERVAAQNRARVAAQLEENARIAREREYTRQREEQSRRTEQERQTSAQSNQALAEKMKIKLKVLNDGMIHLNEKKKLNAPLGYYLAEIEKLLLAIPANLRAEFTADIKAALTAHLYNIMPQLKQGSPEYIKAQQEKAEKERIAAETVARLKAQADAIAAEAEAKRAAAEAESQRLAAESQRATAEQAAAAEAQRVADEQAAAARTAEEKRIADENAARAAAEKAQADAIAAEAKRVADEAAAKAGADASKAAADADAAAKLEEERNKAASGESTPEDVVSKTVAIVNDMTDGEGGLEIAKEVIDNAVNDDPSKAESGNQLIKAAEDAPKKASAGGGGLAVVAALGIGAFLLFGRRR